MCNRTSTLRRALCNPALWLIGAALLLTAQLAAAQTTYAVGAGQSSQVCGTVDLTTGHWTVLNSYLNYVVGLGQFGGNLYGAIGNGLYEVNPANCAFNFVGQGSELAGETWVNGETRRLSFGVAAFGLAKSRPGGSCPSSY